MKKIRKMICSEFDLERLDKLATENSNILTKEILTECKI